MLTSYGPMNFLRRSLQLLNPMLINNSEVSSGKLAPFVLGKELKLPSFRRGLSQLSQEPELPVNPGGNFVKMRGLPYQATTADIINFFKPLNIEPVEVIIEPNRWGQPSGFATAKFKSYDDALKALRNHRNYMGNRYVELSLDMQARNTNLPKRPLEPVSGLFYNKGHRVILKGLPYEATTNDVIQFFAPLNIKPVDVRMVYNRANLPSGICHCTFESREDAVTALKNHKAYLGKRWVEVIVATEEKFSLDGDRD